MTISEGGWKRRMGGPLRESRLCRRRINTHDDHQGSLRRCLLNRLIPSAEGIAMNAVLLSLLATLGGTDGAEYTVSDATVGQGEVVYASPDSDCTARNAGRRGGHHGHCGKGHAPRGGWFGMMPQTCYNPTFGCYDGNRHNHRYPAFHGTFYRRPYNYRNLFDYPWHADLHEPTSHFAYNVQEQATTTIIAPGAHDAIPLPPPVPVPVPDSLGRSGKAGSQQPAEGKIRSASFPKVRKFVR